MFKDNVIGKLKERIGYIEQEIIPQVERVSSKKVRYIENYMEKRRTQIVGEKPETIDELMQKAESKLKDYQEERKAGQPAIEVEDDRIVG